MLRRIQLLRSHLGWSGARSKCRRMQIETEGEELYQCKRLHITFFNLVPSP